MNDKTTKYFDPHIHMVSRTTDDYENMHAAGIVGVIEPAFWQGQARTSVGSFIDYFDTIIGWERFRASQFGIHHFCTIGLNPKEANDISIAEEVIKVLPRYLNKDSVVAVGEIGFDDITEEEERFMAEQMQMAIDFKLPVLIHTPHRDKIGGTRRTIELIKDVGIDEDMVIIDHLNEQTLPMAMETDCWLGHSIYPNTKMSETRMVALLKQYGLKKMVVNSAADWGVSDPLKVPKTADVMRKEGFTESDITKVLFDNPIEFFSKSGRISKEQVSTPIAIDQRQLWNDNSALRGQEPIVE